MTFKRIASAFIIAAAAACAYLLATVEGGATWKPEYAKQDPAVIEWFKNAQLMPAARARLKYEHCCEKAERLMTKFVPAKDKYGADTWSYYVDPACTWKGCKLLPIPPDTVHDDAIPSGPAFKQLRAEGVLFIYNGTVTCFWEPEPGG